ncbi:MFS transporter [Paraburkholderia caballeronis]|uniref:MFS transporter n=1 Tax=Paraburkholderia caballeronis TaxID=416943 RepID=UPI0010650232|nr:MFS transporter [Paraburkholderia caballeronis]TDV19424.1 putative MFS family arabinose efflux permease [Paraburkholderia caballeronis]TDV22024.1 putative MFS family arabinose efflux permease [Paraburkholderia caballeronis]TDV28928.1 putative MFS family arabinose efflux permease [Paraburkholderia caballeronis]
MPQSTAATDTAPSAGVVETDLPSRLDRLPWGRFHVLIVVALGVTWLLDGLEVTLAGAVASALKASPVLHLTNAEVGLAGSGYIAGAVLGALGFGWLTDRLGRRKLFFVTLTVYLLATAATALSWNFASFVAFRFVTGAGIGGEYAAINSTIQEFTPARVRGWTDLGINGTFWVGAGAGAAGSLVLLDPGLLPPDWGWRVCFLIGAALALVILPMRAWVPESPRWLLTHGEHDDARAIVEQIETRFRDAGHTFDDRPTHALRLRARHRTPLADVFRTLFGVHRRRAFVGLSLMTAQAFFYNAIFFTYALVLTDFYGVPGDRVGQYLLPFALGNFLGPLALGRLFDVIGRRVMIAATYALSGILLTVSGYLFTHGLLDVTTQTVSWMVIFFFASAAASSAYLTVSESFPLEIRALAIAVFYAFGTALGGIAGPAFFGRLIDTHQRGEVFTGYLVGSALMIGAAVIAAIWGVDAERKPLEHVATPLSAVSDDR